MNTDLNRAHITRKTAAKISQLINSLVVANSMIKSKADANDHEGCQFWMRDHDATAAELASEFGIDVVTYKR